MPFGSERAGLTAEIRGHHWHFLDLRDKLSPANCSERAVKKVSTIHAAARRGLNAFSPLTLLSASSARIVTRSEPTINSYQKPLGVNVAKRSHHCGCELGRLLPLESFLE